MAAYSVFHYTYDGELLGEKSIQDSELSSKWLAICGDLIATNGPIFKQNLGSTLERFEIKCTAGICHFNVGGAPAFFAAILSVQPDQQSLALLDVFVSHLSSMPLVVDSISNLSAFQAELRAISTRPTFLVVNWLNPDISSQDQEAAFQLALHFAGAYLQWK